MKEMMNRKTIRKAEYRLVLTVIALMGFMLGLSFVYTSSVRYGFHVNENVEGESMYKTLDEDSRILYISHKIRKIRRGDIVNAHAYIQGVPVYHRDSTKPMIMGKRVIALPGETIKIEGSKVYVDGILLDEPYAYYEYDSSDDLMVTLGEDQYFLMGDNRMNSEDSRFFDLSTSESILWVALIVR